MRKIADSLTTASSALFVAKTGATRLRRSSQMRYRKQRELLMFTEVAIVVRVKVNPSMVLGIDVFVVVDWICVDDASVFYL